jgi:phosphate-selective porin OprO/OprP
MKKALQIIIFLSISASHLFSQSTDLDVYWDDGLKFQSKDSAYKFSVGGRVHYDASFNNHSGALDTLFEKAGNKIEVRRARLSFEGSINKALAYEFEFTFGEEIKYADMYFAFLKIPYFERLTVGHFREPFSLEEITSSNSTIFMERSLTGALGPSRNTGIMLQKSFYNNKLKGYAGIFRITDDLGGDLLGEGNHSFSTRWVFNPVLNTNENKTTHFGIGINSFKPAGKIHKIKSSNEANTGIDYLNTGDIKNVENVSQLGGEFGFTKNRLTLQSEYIQSFARFTEDNGKKATRNYNGLYAMASYFLKGGIRKYNKNGNRFSSISSVSSESEKGSIKGAWEVAFRLSHLNLNDDKLEIDKMNNATVGLNWYYNSNSRLMANYMLSNLSNQYNVNTLQFRLQLTF